MKMLKITSSQAQQISGKQGNYSGIIPIGQPDGSYLIPESCLYNDDLISIRSALESMSGNVVSIGSLPDVGFTVYSGQTYTFDTYDLGLTGYSNYVICVQTHERTIYPPYDTPALFTFTRPYSDISDWILNEYVYSGWKRMYSGVQYEVITEHLTQSSWTPPLTLGVLWRYAQTGDIPVWVQPTGSFDAYNTGDIVSFENAVWRSLIDANVWSPTVYPAGWEWLYDL